MGLVVGAATSAMGVSSAAAGAPRADLVLRRVGGAGAVSRQRLPDLGSAGGVGGGAGDAGDAGDAGAGGGEALAGAGDTEATGRGERRGDA